MKKISKKILCNQPGVFSIELPKNSAILSVLGNYNYLELYYLCDPLEKQFYTFKFYVFSSESEMPENIDNLSYLKSTRIDSDVLHIFVDLTASEDAVVDIDLKDE